MPLHDGAELGSGIRTVTLAPTRRAGTGVKGGLVLGTGEGVDPKTGGSRDVRSSVMARELRWMAATSSELLWRSLRSYEFPLSKRDAQ